MADVPFHNNKNLNRGKIPGKCGFKVIETLNNKMNMGILKETAWVLVLTAGVLALNSCDANDEDNGVALRPTALVTVYPSSSEGLTLQLDDSTTIVPSNMKTSPFGEKEVRALVNYTVESMVLGKPRSVYVNWIDSIRTKMPVVSQGDDDEKIYGNDPIEIVRDWVSVAEDGYLTLRIRTLWSETATHVINLVGGVNKDNKYEFDLRQNAYGDTNGRMGDALIAFNLNSLWEDRPEKVKIKVNWTSFSGEKSTEFDLKMHNSTEVVSNSRRLSASYIVE